MRIEYAKLSLIGDRQENQDRVLVVTAERGALMMVIDGMGGHADGALAAEVASETLAECFKDTESPVFDPQGFLHRAIGKAHANLVSVGAKVSMEARPRATCAACLIQDGSAFWAHVGDSRIYLLRNNRIVERTRDHSHVELLLQEGVITKDELSDHPMRNFVECCLGGDSALPGMTVTRAKKLQPGDTLLACSDGLWSGLSDNDIASMKTTNGELAESLRALGESAVRICGPHADNTSAVALRWDE